MNKIIGVSLMDSRKPAEAEPLGQKPIADLREWLARVEEIGELTRVSQPVDRDEEMSAISYLVAKQQPSPAVLFERPRGFDKSPIGAKMLWNILGPSVKRVALTLEEPADTPTVELIRRVKDKLKRRLPPREVPAGQAPIYQNTITGKSIDLNQLPIPRHWPLDGGRYAGTGDAVITRDPDSGYLNVGTYRMMVQGKAQVGLYLSPGKDARLHITRAWQQGKPINVAAAWGIDPLFMLVGSQTFPKNVSEYEYAGGIKGEPIPVVRGKTTDLLIPANAELVIEGVIRPNSVKAEGPFGEFPGYYGRPEAGCPLVDITAVHYRSRPILTNALMADYPSCEQSGFFSVIRSAKIWDDLDKLGIPGIQGVYAHPAAAGGFGMTVISLEQRYAGHAAQALALAAQVPGGAVALAGGEPGVVAQADGAFQQFALAGFQAAQVMNSPDDSLIIAKLQRISDVRFFQNFLFHTFHEESDHISSRDGIESIEVTEIFSLDDRRDTHVFALGSETPDILVFRAFDKGPLILPLFYLRNLATVDGASVAGFIPDIKRLDLFFVHDGSALKDSFLKISDRMDTSLIHAREDSVCSIFLAAPSRVRMDGQFVKCFPAGPHEILRMSDGNGMVPPDGDGLEILRSHDRSSTPPSKSSHL